MTMPRMETPTQPRVGTTNPFATTEDFGKQLKTRGEEATLTDERAQLEHQAFTNANTLQRVQRVGGWVAIDASITVNQPVTPLSQQLAATVTAAYNGYGKFTGTPLTEQDVQRVLADMNNNLTPDMPVPFTVGRVRARLMLPHLATSQEDLDGFSRIITDATIQVARWCNRTKDGQLQNATVEADVHAVATRVIQAMAAEGEYARILPGLLVCDINTGFVPGGTAGRINN